MLAVVTHEIGESVKARRRPGVIGNVVALPDVERDRVAADLVTEQCRDRACACVGRRRYQAAQRASAVVGRRGRTLPLLHDLMGWIGVSLCRLLLVEQGFDYVPGR